MSRRKAQDGLLIQKDFSNNYVQARRDKIIKLSNSMEVHLHDLVNLFFNPINPTLAVAQRDYGHEDILIFCINFNKIISDKKLSENIGKKNNDYIKDLLDIKCYDRNFREIVES